MNDISFEEFRSMLLYHRIMEWSHNNIVLDNGVSISIEETEQDCCASAAGAFENVVLDAAITYVSEPKYNLLKEEWGEYSTSAIVKFLHNQNLICQANGEADAGNGGYYYSVASFIVCVPGKENQSLCCHFVSSEDGWED